MKIKYLEGLRGFAALVVFLAHLKYACFVDSSDKIDALIYQLNTPNIFKNCLQQIVSLLLNDELAVWVFWVLSAYVISNQFFKPHANYNKLLIGYFAKRYFRLFFPVLAAVIFAFLLLKFELMFNCKLANLSGKKEANEWLSSLYNFKASFYCALQSACFDTFFNFNKASSYNAVLWTIQNEFLGSLFIFSIFGIVRHNKMRFVFYFLIAFILFKLIMLWLLAFVVGYILSDYRFSETNNRILKQIKLFEFKFHQYSIIIFVLSLIYIIAGKSIFAALKIPSFYYPFCASIFIVYILTVNKYFQTLFSSNILFWLGNISFSLYLIHLPIICSLTSYMVIVNYSFHGKIISIICTLISALVGANLFNKYIDQKSVFWANKIGDYFKNQL